MRRRTKWIIGIVGGLVVVMVLGGILGDSPEEDTGTVMLDATPAAESTPSASTPTLTPIPTLEPTVEMAGRGYMQAMPCDAVLRYDEAALNDLDDPYNEHINMAIVLNRITQDAHNIGYSEVRERVLECSSQGTPGDAYLLTLPCDIVLADYAYAQELAYEQAQTQEQRGWPYITLALTYTEDTKAFISTRDVIVRVEQCR